MRHDTPAEVSLRIHGRNLPGSRPGGVTTTTAAAAAAARDVVTGATDPRRGPVRAAPGTYRVTGRV